MKFCFFFVFAISSLAVSSQICPSDHFLAVFMGLAYPQNSVVIAKNTGRCVQMGRNARVDNEHTLTAATLLALSIRESIGHAYRPPYMGKACTWPNVGFKHI